jgi:tol-pal system protein YbgF
MRFRVSRVSRVAAVLAAAAPLLSGCYGKRLASLEVRTARIEDHVDKLSRMQSELSTTVQALNRLVDEEVQQARSGRAGNEQRLREIQSLLQVLTTRMDENRVRFGELKDDLKYSRPSAAADSATGGATPRALYDAAYQDLTRGNHGLALMGFQEVLAKFPTSELADNAQYWIGESYYAQKDYRQAQKEFEKVEGSYPQGDKVPAALLKLGFCLQQQGDKAAAHAAFQKLVQRFPNTEEARLAGAKLQEN